MSQNHAIQRSRTHAQYVDREREGERETTSSKEKKFNPQWKFFPIAAFVSLYGLCIEYTLRSIFAYTPTHRCAWSLCMWSCIFDSHRMSFLSITTLFEVMHVCSSTTKQTNTEIIAKSLTHFFSEFQHGILSLPLNFNQLHFYQCFNVWKLIENTNLISQNRENYRMQPAELNLGLPRSFTCDSKKTGNNDRFALFRCPMTFDVMRPLPSLIKQWMCSRLMCIFVWFDIGFEIF